MSKAYGILSDTKLRHEYDVQLKALELSQQWPISDIVELNQLDYNEEQDGTYSHQCRCGGIYEVSAEDLRCGASVVCCSGCSLCIKVVTADAPRRS